MDAKLKEAMNEQIRNEFYSAYMYLAMAAYCESVNLPGFSHWLKVQAREEQDHGMKIFSFLIDTGVRVKLLAIDQPPAEFESATDVFEQVLKHEKKITALINKLYNLAVEANDTASMVMLQWFVTEQVEEEKNAARILSMLKMVRPDSAGMIMLDRELGKREG
jgi:ferritin